MSSVLIVRPSSDIVLLLCNSYIVGVKRRQCYVVDIWKKNKLKSLFYTFPLMDSFFASNRVSLDTSALEPSSQVCHQQAILRGERNSVKSVNGHGSRLLGRGS